MAESKQIVDAYLEEFICPICLELFNVPVMLECGHNFCRSCITKVWDIMKTPSCPECREKSSAKRYVMNRLLANQVAKTKRLTLQPKSNAFGENVGTKEKEMEQYCRQHGRKLELFCQQDMLLSCVLCVPEHRSHYFLPLYEAAVMYKDKIGTALSSLKSELNHLIESQQKQEKIISDTRDTSQNLKQHIKSEFVKLHLFLEDKEQQLIQQLKEDAATILGKMEENLKEIKNRSSTIQEELSSIQSTLEQEDFLCFLTGIQPVMERLTKDQEDVIDNVRVVSDDLNKGMYSYFLQYDVWKDMKCILSLAPTPVILNPDTAHSSLILSEDLTSVRYGGEVMKQLPNNPERFDKKPYVLGSKGFTHGRHFWEVNVGTKNTWILGVAKESINRKGETVKRPDTGYWIVWRNAENKYFALDSVDKTLCLSESPQRIRVYLDYDRGELSFYGGDSISHIYTFKDTFTEKLFPIFSPWYNINDNDSEALKLFHLSL